MMQFSKDRGSASKYPSLQFRSGYPLRKQNRTFSRALCCILVRELPRGFAYRALEKSAFFRSAIFESFRGLATAINKFYHLIATAARNERIAE